ncbi:MAG TPA: DUF4157 domain-containing protein, partial [Jatrophihabitans sp.]|nr:DUF4157 domain-containing protein [Jatrophihabitans sp.]
GDDGGGDASPDAEPDAAPPLAPVTATAPSTPAPIQPMVVPGRPIVDGTGRPASTAAPLLFRARATRPPLGADKQTVERAVITRPPAELAHALRSTHGIDVTDVPVQRDGGAGSEARQRQARAFTRGGRVFLPEEAGHLSSAQARGLLAHELVHAAQQRRLGHALPGEDTAEGRALEIEAQQAERMYSSAPTEFAEPELIHAPHAVTPGWVAGYITQHAGPPIDYFDDSTVISESQRQNFQDAVDEGVRQVMADYYTRTGVDPSSQQPSSNSASGPFSSLTEEQVAERQFLDVINTELERRGEAAQTALSEDDRAKVRDLLGRGASGQNAPQAEDPSARSRWAEATFGSGTALGADLDGLLAFTSWGRTDTQNAEIERRKREQEHGGNQQPVPPGAGLGSPMSTRPPTTGSRPIPGHGTSQIEQISAFGGWQQRAFGSDMALGGDLGGLARLFHGGRAEESPRTQPAHHQPQPTTHDTAQHAEHGAHPRTGADSAALQEPDDYLDTGRLDLDDLATRIFDRLRSRLRRELLVDRERAGLLTDFR